MSYEFKYLMEFVVISVLDKKKWLLRDCRNNFKLRPSFWDLKITPRLKRSYLNISCKFKSNQIICCSAVIIDHNSYWQNFSKSLYIYIFNYCSYRRALIAQSCFHKALLWSLKGVFAKAFIWQIDVSALDFWSSMYTPTSHSDKKIV